jgi:hypothetical protein
VTIYNLVMELTRTPHGLVTPLAVVRAVRNTSLKMLARQVGAPWNDVRDWEAGEARIPTAAMTKRLGLALGWKWQDLTADPLDPDDAWQTLCDARQRIAAAQ